MISTNKSHSNVDYDDWYRENTMVTGIERTRKERDKKKTTTTTKHEHQQSMVRFECDYMSMCTLFIYCAIESKFANVHVTHDLPIYFS